MSELAMIWVLTQAPGLPAHAGMVLMGLAHLADETGRGAIGEQTILSAYARKTARQVRRDLADLEEGGLIRRGDQGLAAHFPPDRRPVVWDLAVERGPQSPAALHARPVVDDRADADDQMPAAGHDRPAGHQRPDVAGQPDGSARAPAPGRAGPGGRQRPAAADRADLGDRPDIDRAPEDAPDHRVASSVSGRSSAAGRTPAAGAGPAVQGARSSTAARTPTTGRTRIPEDFAVTPEMLGWACQFAPRVSLRSQTDAFIECWRAAPEGRGLQEDWTAAWRAWMREAAGVAAGSTLTLTGGE